MARSSSGIQLIAAALLLALPRLADAGADADDVVQRVQATVLRLKTQLPDFLCRETITSQLRTRRRVLQQTVIVSRFPGRQIQSSKTDLSFDETRLVHSVNGKPAPPRWPPPAPFLFTGGFSSTLGSTFGARANSRPCRDFRRRLTQAAMRRRAIPGVRAAAQRPSK